VAGRVSWRLTPLWEAIKLIFGSSLTEVLTRYKVSLLIRSILAEEAYDILEEIEFYLMREECEIDRDYTLLLWIIEYTLVRVEQSVILAKIEFYDWIDIVVQALLWLL